MLGYIGFMVKNCGVEIKEIVEGGMRDIVINLLIKIGVMSRGFGGKVRRFGRKVGDIAIQFGDVIGDKATNLVEKIQVQGSGEKVLNNLESELS